MRDTAMIGVGMHTPWGKAQDCLKIADGIYRIDTPGHGGYYLTVERRKQVHPALLNATCNDRGLLGFFEEDCDWSIVAYTFPEHFPARAYQEAINFLRRFHKEAFAKINPN